MYNSQDIAARIKSQAVLKKKTIKGMMADCGLGRNTVSKISNGTDVLSLNLAKIADYLGVSIDYLMGRTDNTEVNR